MIILSYIPIILYNPIPIYTNPIQLIIITISLKSEKKYCENIMQIM